MAMDDDGDGDDFHFSRAETSITQLKKYSEKFYPSICSFLSFLLLFYTASQVFLFPFFFSSL